MSGAEEGRSVGERLGGARSGGGRSHDGGRLRPVKAVERKGHVWVSR
jgi:hypothetical protein